MPDSRIFQRDHLRKQFSRIVKNCHLAERYRAHILNWMRLTQYARDLNVEHEGIDKGAPVLHLKGHEVNLNIAANYNKNSMGRGAS